MVYVTGRRGVMSLALLSKPYILTYMKDARIHEGYRRTITSHRRRARTYDVVVLRSPSCKSNIESCNKLLYSAVGLRHLHKGKRPIEFPCALHV